MKKLSILTLTLIAMGLFVASCDKDDDPIMDPIDKYNPIVLDCDYLKTDRTLSLNPDSDVDYLVTCWMNVEGHIKVEPGVVIEFEEKAGINVEESSNAQISFAAVGTSNNPIIFKGKESRKGYWTGIQYLDASSPNNELKNVVIQDAGYERYFSHDAGAVIVKGNDVTNLKISNTAFRNNKNYGLNVDVSKVYLNEFKNNSFAQNDVPIRTHPNNLGALDKTTSYTGNVNDYIFINSYSTSIDRNLTWHKVDVPYLLEADFAASHGGLGIFADVVMEAGVEVIMTKDSKITVGHFGQDGSLAMNGTEDDEIIIRGEEATPGYWEHIRFANNDAKNKMSYVKLMDAGKTDVSSTNDPNGVLLVDIHRVDGLVLDIDNITFENSVDFAINIRDEYIDKADFQYSNLNFGTPREFGDFDNNPILNP
ncbi:MAG TPA: hypothetical protein VLZ33_05135 [Dysgonamonadaceae bacterium]|nr:hypothetical protein [Dysgonamonadaceae bacterium]